VLFNPENLKIGRKRRGINKTQLASLINVDLRSVSAWEAGTAAPLEVNLSNLSNALNLPEGFFFASVADMPDPEQVSFRAISKLQASKRDMALAASSLAFSFADWLEDSYDLPKFDVPDLRHIHNAEEAAQILRNEWGQGNQPIANMIHLLESKGVRVFSLALDMTEVDAFCTWRNETPFIFLNMKKSNARSRFDAAHELAHLVLHRHGNYSGRETEREADQFASAFLMPREGVIPTKPRLLDINNSIKAKQEWGASLAAYIVRMNSLGQLTEWQYRSLFKQLSQRGYRKSEPLDHRKEQSKLLEFILSDLRSEGVSLYNISQDLMVSQSDLVDLCFDLATIGLPSNAKPDSTRKVDREHISVVVDNTKNDKKLSN